MTDALLLLTAQQPMYNGSGPNSWGGHLMYSPFGSLFMILLLVALVVVLAMVLKRTANRDGDRDKDRETPLDILKRRYAAGEIDKAQYDEMKRNLTE